MATNPRLPHGPTFSSQAVGGFSEGLENPAKERSQGRKGATMSKNYDGWCIARPSGEILRYTFMVLRVDCIETWCWPVPRRMWKLDFYPKGYRCVKVRIEKVTT